LDLVGYEIPITDSVSVDVKNVVVSDVLTTLVVWEN
jgi:hypothetical protein